MFLIKIYLNKSMMIDRNLSPLMTIREYDFQ